MRLYSTIIIGISLLIFNNSVIGQTKVQGVFIRSENSQALTVYEELIIKNDSIWLSSRKVGRKVPRGQKNQTLAGTVKYYKNGYNSGPFYYGSLFVMSCDTCPQFWKYTTNRKDSLDTETHIWTSGKTDTVIKNGDTSYVKPEIVAIEDPSDLHRTRELIFTMTDDGDILIDRNIYRKKRD